MPASQGADSLEVTLKQYAKNPLVILGAIAVIVGAVWYHKYSADSADEQGMEKIVGQAQAIVTQKVAPLRAKFLKDYQRLPYNNAELGLPEPASPTWKPFTKVELWHTGSVRFEFADPVNAAKSAVLVSRWVPPGSIGAVECGQRNIPAGSLLANGLICNDQVDPPPALSAAQLATAQVPGAQGAPAAQTMLVAKTAVTPAERVMEAINHDNAAALESLRAEKVDVCSPDTGGRLPLAEAARGNQLKTLAVLTAASCNLDQLEPFSQLTPAMVAVMMRNTKVLDALLAAGANTNLITPTGVHVWFALQRVSDPASLQMRESLLGHGTDIDMRTADGSTLLMLAADDGALDLMDWAVRHGAKIDLPDPAGHTPLMRAIIQPRGEPALRWLIAHHANVNLRDAENHSAFGIARLIPDPNRQKSLLAILAEAGGKP